MLVKDFVNIFLLFSAALISVVPWFENIFRLKGNIFSILCLLAINFILFNKLNLRKALFLCLPFFILALLSVFYWEELYLLKIQIYFYLAILTATSVDDRLLKKFIEFSSTILCIILFLSVISFFYRYYGNPSLFEILNPDGRSNFFYLTSFGTETQNRVSGIFDEPGTLSFISSIIVFLRDKFSLSFKKSIFILFLGIFTISIAHFIFFSIYLLHLLIKVRSLKSLKNYVFFFILFSIFLFLIHSRFTEFLGQDRISAFFNAYALLDSRSFLFGMDSVCQLGKFDCVGNLKFNDILVPLYGDNPLTLLVHYGIFISFPYYFFMLYLLHIAIRKSSLILFAIFLLLLQRPYIMSFGFSILLSFVIIALLRERKSLNYD